MKKEITAKQKDWMNNKVDDKFSGSFKKTYKKACEGSLRAAINAKCQDCSCYQNVEIKNCSVETCPLWNVRPLQSKD